jgi:hypothetical protein
MMTTAPQRTEAERWRREESPSRSASRCVVLARVGLALRRLVCLGITLACPNRGLIARRRVLSSGDAVEGTGWVIPRPRPLEKRRERGERSLKFFEKAGRKWSGAGESGRWPDRPD